MKKYLSLIIASSIIVLAVFVINLKLMPSNHFQEFEYDQTDWKATQNTYFDSYLSGIEKVPNGTKLKPVVRVGKEIIVDLPDGRRGSVNALSLSGAEKYSVIGHYLGREITDLNIVGRVDKSKLPQDGKSRFIKFISYRDHFYKIKMKGSNRYNTQSAAKNIDFNKMPPVVVLSNNGKFYSSTRTHDLPDFANNIPIYNDNFRLYTRSEMLANLNKEEIINKYGDPLYIDNIKGDDILYYRHLLTKKNWYKNGTNVICNRDTSYIESYNASEYYGRSVSGDHRSLISLTGLRWTQLPGAFWIVSNTKMNLQPLSSYESPLPLTGIICFVVACLLLWIFSLAIPALIDGMFGDFKKLNNTLLYIIYFVVGVPIMVFIAAHCIEFSRDSWGVISIISAAAICFSIFKFDKTLTFNRCKFCNSRGSLSNVKKFLNEETSYKTVYEYYDKKELTNSRSNSVDTKHIHAVDPEDFRNNKTRITSEYCDVVKYEIHTKYYRYHFKCSACKNNWTMDESERDKREISRRKVLTKRLTEECL